MNFFCLLVPLMATLSLCSPQYGVSPRFFFIPLNGGAGTSSFNLFNTDRTAPFLLPGRSCTGYNIFTGQVLAGTCQDYASCVFKQRYLGGPCALGLKTCCIPKSLTTTITNPTPATTQTTTIHPFSNQYCQVRLDFDDLVLGDPVNGDCPLTERFEVSGQAGPANVPTLCGQIGGTGLNQHMYLEFNVDPSTKRVSPITVTISTSSSASTWSIRATQIQCNDQASLAPSGCLQFFNTSSGSVRSFNFRDSGAAPTAINQLNNQNYMICLNPTATSVTWTAASAFSFSLTGMAGVPTAINGVLCTTDYVFIRNGAQPNGAGLSERNCGSVFPASIVASNASPLSLLYVTDSTEAAGDTFNQGFNLQFSVV